uniref:Uncharacterized protein n=1 Tax=Arundo donax TaxID=35708 RepID=A0A0A9CH05_ARUDO
MACLTFGVANRDHISNKPLCIEKNCLIDHFLLSIIQRRNKICNIYP